MLLDGKLIIKHIFLFGAKASDKVSSFVGTWTFVFLYTGSMFAWVGLHTHDMLHIDSPDFMKWNLFLSWFAGTQASILLMSSTRQANADRVKQQEALEFDIQTYKLAKQNAARTDRLLKHIQELESVIDDFIEEQSDE